MKDSAFEIIGDTECADRGLGEENFREIDTGETAVDFDLAYADIVENRIETMWLDLIFDDPAMNQVRMRDLTFCRYPRAEV